jgi:hypothetical protein
MDDLKEPLYLVDLASSMAYGPLTVTVVKPVKQNVESIQKKSTMTLHFTFVQIF